MFWKKVEGLSPLPISSKVAITLFLCVAGIGYVLGFFNIYFNYSGVDGKPGLSMADIRIAFHGSGGVSTLEKAVDGVMKQNFASDAEYNKVKAWLKAGAKEADFNSVKDVFASSCISCHSTDAKTGGVALENYSEASAVLQIDSGKSIPRLVSLSHLHVMGILSLVFLLCLVFSFTAFAEPVKIVVMAFSLCSIVVDIGSWWLAKFFAAMAPLVILGGVCLAISFLALILLPLYDLWLRKAVV
ncbi:MAG: hypothetical protein ABSG21_14925 [Spirochaetia bacterium]|jgi:hypothetical protein